MGSDPMDMRASTTSLVSMSAMKSPTTNMGGHVTQGIPAFAFAEGCCGRGATALNPNGVYVQGIRPIDTREQRN